MIVVYREQDCETGNANADGYDGEQKAVLRSVGQPRDQHREAKRCSPRRDRVQLRLNGTVAVALDDLWTEVRVAIGRHNQPKVHETADENLGIFEREV